MSKRIRGWGIALAIAAVCLMLPTSVFATTFDFSYKFKRGTMSGSFTGDIDGNKIVNVDGFRAEYKGREVVGLRTLFSTVGVTLKGRGRTLNFDDGAILMSLQSKRKSSMKSSMKSSRKGSSKSSSKVKLSKNKKKKHERIGQRRWKIWVSTPPTTPSAVPEPSAAVVFLGGLVVIAEGVRRKRR